MHEVTQQVEPFLYLKDNYDLKSGLTCIFNINPILPRDMFLISPDIQICSYSILAHFDVILMQIDCRQL